MKLAVVGVTGLVGTEILSVLDEMSFRVDEFLPVASASSKGRLLNWRNRNYEIIDIEEAVRLKPDIAIFSAGGETSLAWAPRFAEVGTFVIDNSSAWRMNSDCPLVVPEINPDSISGPTRIIANPNCSTIQMVLVLCPLHRAFGIERIVVSTYQLFSGTGMKAVRQYEAEKNGIPVPEPRAYKHPIFQNCIPQCDSFLENNYTKEEMKLVNETRKILGDHTLRITATAVRVPVFGGHSESVNVQFKTPPEISRVYELLKSFPGVVVQDDPENAVYPTPLNAHKKNEVFVGRIRKDLSEENALNLWITADNLRKGAATNAVQIAQYIVDHQLI